MKRLENKVAIITGGGGGIGSATAALFVREGAKVLLVDCNEQALREVVHVINNKDAVSYVLADVTQPDQVQNYVNKAVERYGRIDVFINNAGIEDDFSPITEHSIETFDKVMAVNVKGVWLGLKYVIPEMEKQGGGSIVITSSTSGVSGAPGLSAYVASKHAVVGIMRSVAPECAPLNIRVNTINPGITETQMMRALEKKILPENPQQARQDLLEQCPLKRYATPEEIAKFMLFLAGDESSYCTGGVYMVDGGRPKRR